ncbi:MAG: DUF1330 domain-containing protein, partial [Bariatricus sp.]
KGEVMVFFLATVNYEEGNDRDAYAEYIQRVKPIVEKHHGRYLTRSEDITALHPEWQPDRVILIAFESREQLDVCFNSREYREIAQLRENSVTSRAIIIE